MASDPPAHAFAGEDDSAVMAFAQRRQGRPMGGDELGQRVRAPSALDRVRIIERLDPADRAEQTRERPHPRMRGWGPRAGREQKGDATIGHRRLTYQLMTMRPNASRDLTGAMFHAKVQRRAPW